MSNSPLAAASRRLRENPPGPGWPRKRGRPRKHPALPAATTNGVPPTAPESPAAVTSRLRTPARTRENTGRNDGAGAYETPAPRRLLALRATAAYLGLAPWTVRELEWSGVLRRVCVPLPNGGELHKLLFDRADLDALIDRWKDAPATGAKAAPKPEASP